MKLQHWIPAVAVAAFLAGGAVLGQNREPGAPALDLAPVPAPAVERLIPQSRTELQLSFAPVVRKVVSSVVNVYATRVEEVAA
jgi:S1-C subfamily serine protease